MGKLAELFRPPFEIMTKIKDFDSVLVHAAKQGKWILIHIHDTENFDSLKMNRDVWRDEKVRAIINEHFVFVQV